MLLNWLDWLYAALNAGFGLMIWPGVGFFNASRFNHQFTTIPHPLWSLAYLLSAVLFTIGPRHASAANYGSAIAASVWATWVSFFFSGFFESHDLSVIPGTLTLLFILILHLIRATQVWRR